MANIIAGLGAQLGLDTTEFKKGIAEAKSSLREFKEHLPEILSIAALTEITREAMNYANAIVQVAKANEVATASVIELSKALDENGGDAEATGQIYAKFTQNLENAIIGNDKLQTSFAKLGITLKDLSTLTEQQLFEKATSALGHMTDAVERNGLAMTIFGKAVRGVDFRGMAEDLAENKGKFDQYASAVEKAHELIKKLKDSHEALVLNWTNSTIPSLALLYESYTKTSDQMEKLNIALKWGAMLAVTTIKEITTAVSQLWNILKGLGTALWNLAHLDFSKAAESVSKGWEDAKKDGEDYLNFIRELLKVNSQVQEPKIKGPTGPQNRPVIASYSDQLGLLQTISNEYQKQSEIRLKQLIAIEKEKNMTKEEKEMDAARTQVLLEQDRILAEIDKKRAAIDPKKHGASELIAELDKQKNAIERWTFWYINKTEDVVKAQQDMRKEFVYGWEQAFNQFRENAMNAADAGRQSFDSIVSSMTSALENFVKTGKLSFSDLAKSIISDLISIQIRLQMSKLFSGMSFGNILSMLPGQTAAPSTVMLQAEPFAAGGDPPVGVPSLVGENGPELFIPHQAGTIIPNGQFGGGQGQTINYNGPYIENMSAIDTKSFEDRIFNSSRAVWAAGQYAQKSLAVQTGRM